MDVTRWKTVMEMGSMTGKRILPFFNYDEGVEIDYTSDLVRADAVLRSSRVSRIVADERAAPRSREIRHPV